jgi:hypothetical protein
MRCVWCVAEDVVYGIHEFVESKYLRFGASTD